MTRITSIAALLDRFHSGQCRRRPITFEQVLGNVRRRDKRRAYFAIRHREQLEAEELSLARVRRTR